MSRDFEKREIGVRSQMAVEALATAVWARSADLLRRADGLYEQAELTPERAQEILIGLIEQRKLMAQLSGQAQEGLRANRRIVDRMETETKAQEAALARQEHGGNRFFRSRARPAG